MGSEPAKKAVLTDLVGLPGYWSGWEQIQALLSHSPKHAPFLCQL